MPRPLSTDRSELSAPVIALRESFGETQLEFSRRLGCTPTTLARYETSRPPRGAALEKLFHIAQKKRHPSANMFLLAMDYERELRGKYRRLKTIGDPRNLDKAGAELTGAWYEYQRMMQDVRKFDPQLVWVSAAEVLGERLLRLADLILVEKRKEIE